MITTVISLVATVVVMVVVVIWLRGIRSKGRAAQVADLQGICGYATARGLTVQQAATKSAFTATGTLEGTSVSLTTSHLKLVAQQGHMATGPIETHLRARGLPTSLRLLVARPLHQRQEVESPLQRGADRLGTGDGAFDARFHCYAAEPGQLERWLDSNCREQMQRLGTLREARLVDGELSISLVSSIWLDGEGDGRPLHHVRPLVREPETLDRAARLLARLKENTKKLFSA